MTPFIFIWLAAFGLVLGSFLNVVIGRLPAGESIVTPGSRCPACRKPIHWYDNIPVVSYLLLGGRCRACRASISWRYPLTELATGVAFVLQGFMFAGEPVVLAQRLVFTAILIALFGTDLETQRLPNVLTLPGIVIGLLFSPFVPPGWFECLVGAALGAAVLGAIRMAWKRARGVEGMGLGDVKMIAMIGAFLGWTQVWAVLFLSSLVGAAVGLAMTASRSHSMQSKLPFGTFLAAAAFAASLVGEPLVNWYIGLFP